MIEVKYNRYLNRLTMDGHAGSAPIGHDLVCSAASILAHTLAANVEHMADAGMCLDVVQDIQDRSVRPEQLSVGASGSWPTPSRMFVSGLKSWPASSLRIFLSKSWANGFRLSFLNLLCLLQVQNLYHFLEVIP